MNNKRAQPTTLPQWLDYIQQQHPSAIDLGLDRIRPVAHRMGIGRLARHVIVVAGTNGKGSTVAMLSAIAQAAGLSVGTYTSPHLVVYNERVQVNGRVFDETALSGAFAQVEQARCETPLTYFEFGTLAACYLLQQQSLDLCVLEVGLGGRLDAVNLIDADVAVITTVDIDHTALLGADRESIGREKAGIMRPNRPVILGDIDPPSSVLRRAYQLNANALRCGSDFFYAMKPPGHWQWWDLGCRLHLPPPGLPGPVQYCNAATAIAALRALPITISRSAWREGVRSARIAGRYEERVVHGIRVIFDVAHNRQAACAVAQALVTRPVSGQTIAVFAALSDKDVMALAQPLGDLVDGWILAGLAGPRGQSAETLADQLRSLCLPVVALAATVTAGVNLAWQHATVNDRVLIFGSFLTVAQAMEVLHPHR